MSAIRTVAVYCGSNTGKGDAYLRAASKLGTVLAVRGIEIVYGGTHKGLMGALADAALAGGGYVTGVITERLKAKGHTHQQLNAIEALPTMQARKKRMIELADAFIAMPGGIGTLEEFMEVWTLNQLGEIAKPAGLYDAQGYYQPLMGMVDHMIAEQFLPASHHKAIVVQSAPEALIDGLVNFAPVTTQKWMS
ncbi:TIGR00730 family Rossman fold protein [Roseobacter sp.]|uniref:LOG family protein n=1 Tax=Roseobacter sp. TaxID=1907202 RepID=UPI00329821B5